MLSLSVAQRACGRRATSELGRCSPMFLPASRRHSQARQRRLPAYPWPSAGRGCRATGIVPRLRERRRCRRYCSPSPSAFLARIRSDPRRATTAAQCRSRQDRRPASHPCDDLSGRQPRRHVDGRLPRGGARSAPSPRIQHPRCRRPVLHGGGLGVGCRAGSPIAPRLRPARRARLDLPSIGRRVAVVRRLRSIGLQQESAPRTTLKQ